MRRKPCLLDELEASVIVLHRLHCSPFREEGGSQRRPAADVGGGVLFASDKSGYQLVEPQPADFFPSRPMEVLRTATPTLTRQNLSGQGLGAGDALERLAGLAVVVEVWGGGESAVLGREVDQGAFGN